MRLTCCLQSWTLRKQLHADSVLLHGVLLHGGDISKWRGMWVDGAKHDLDGYVDDVVARAVSFLRECVGEVG